MHAAHRALAGGRDHVVTVGGGAVAHQFGVYFRAAGEGVLQFFHDQHAAATGDDKAVAVGVVGAGGLLGSIVVFGGQGAHGVEQAAQRPVQFLTAAGKYQVLLAHLYLLHGVAYAVGAGGAGGGNRIVHPLDPEGGGQAGGDGAAHGLGDAVGTHPTQAALAQDVGGLDLHGGGGAAGARYDAGAHIGDIRLLQARIVYRLLHGDIGVRGRIGHEAQLFAIDQRGDVDLRGAGDM